jgi:ribonuclease R
VQRQTRRLPAEVEDWDPREREDLRDLMLVTIDGSDARDFDDAVCCQPLRGGRGWRLWVAIADVSSYVVPGSALDAEGLNRGNSVYFPERVIPMLPEALSNGLCSLNPDVDRLCMVCEMRVDPSGAISKSRFFQGVMRSHARLIYEDVAALLETPHSALARRRPDLVEPLRALDQVYQALFKARGARGAIDFDSTETRIVFDDQRKIAAIEPVTRTRAHRLIEECMIAANVEAAQFAERHQVPILYRVHARPDAEKIEVLREFLAVRGLQLRGGDTPQAADFARLVEQLAGRPDAALVQSVMLRSLMQARYSVENIGHFGLALEHYAHFTSPIRRYPDLLLHRAVKEILASKQRGRQKAQAAALEPVGAHCSMTERRADEATRDVVNWLKCEYMSHRLGEEFAGVVTAVVPFGLFISLEGMFVEGLIHISRLGTDFFEYDGKHQRLVGTRSHKTFSLGERLNVRVGRVNVEERKIDLELVSGERGSAGQSRSSRSKRGRGR